MPDARSATDAVVDLAPAPTPTVVVVGAGIAGLAAAWQLVRAGARVLILESADRVGGKLAVGEVAGVRVDLGAESLLARRPEAVDLAREVGLADELTTPRAVGASLWSRGALHPLPRGTMMGVPSATDGLLGLLDAADVAAVAAEPGRSWPALTDDVDVATFVRRRVGAGVVDRLVEPLLGGVYAGHATRLSLRASVPALWAAATEGRSVVQSAARAAAAGTATQAPVFAGLRGGVGRLPVAVAQALTAAGAVVQLGTTVRGLARTPSGWRLLVGPTTDETTIDADAVVLATPAAATTRLLRPHAPHAAATLSRVGAASVAIVTLAVPRADVRGLTGSGLLVPPVDGRTIKAATWSSGKWAWLDESAGDLVLLRASLGRHDEVETLQHDDADLVRTVLADLRSVPDVVLPDPVQARVTRWGGGLPQYAVGHVDAVASVRSDVARFAGLAVAGATYDGVGVPACIASGRRAADEVLASWRGAGRA